ncbi:MAG TPA: hypothetical protein VFQ61_06930 [Polyangiaceae bacterium]|nr:hypothetical protein [Polyangiaceae bacterium]
MDCSSLSPAQLIEILCNRRRTAELVATLEPVVRTRVTRTLCRFGRCGHEEIEDATQEVLIELFTKDARTLRSWQPERGLSLLGFVQFVAHRVALARLKQVWLDRAQQPLEACEDRAADSVLRPDRKLATRRQFERLLERLQVEVSPRGVQLFRALFMEQHSLSRVCSEFGLQPDAVYAWRSRLSRRARNICAELEPPSTPRTA